MLQVLVRRSRRAMQVVKELIPVFSEAIPLDEEGGDALGGAPDLGSFFKHFEAGELQRDFVNSQGQLMGQLIDVQISCSVGLLIGHARPS
jgi:hypothetical protein